jgi:hypothetical protein
LIFEDVKQGWLVSNQLDLSHQTRLPTRLNKAQAFWRKYSNDQDHAIIVNSPSILKLKGRLK